MKFELNKVYNMDCLEAMKQIPDKFFELAIVDPPYFSGPEKRGHYGREINAINVKRVNYPTIQNWSVPGTEYFEELIRVSKNQIVWGCNYYAYSFGPGRIVWDKVNASSSFSDCELAYCSLHDSVRLFRFMWNGMLQGKSISEGHVMQGNKSLNEKRIHPTQKPVLLYKWQLAQYAKPGDKILDTHVGSQSSRIACHDLGFDFLGFDTDKKIFDLGTARFNQHIRQQVLFPPLKSLAA